MTQADAEGLCALADILLANDNIQVEFKTGVKSESAGDYLVEIWNSSNQYTEKLRTARDVAEFFRTKFMLSPVFCFHRGEYRNPKDDPSRPFLCPHCEHLSYTVSISGESATVTSGVLEVIAVECGNGHHSNCTDDRCRCECHGPPPSLRQ